MLSSALEFCESDNLGPFVRKGSAINVRPSSSSNSTRFLSGRRCAKSISADPRKACVLIGRHPLRGQRYPSSGIVLAWRGHAVVFEDQRSRQASQPLLAPAIRGDPAAFDRGPADWWRGGDGSGSGQPTPTVPSLRGLQRARQSGSIVSRLWPASGRRRHLCQGEPGTARLAGGRVFSGAGLKWILMCF